MIYIEQDERHATLENPGDSAMFKESPIKAVADARPFCFHKRKTAMCALSPLPDGERHHKLTMLTPTFPLTRSYKRCTCTRGHVELFGYDSENHCLRTAAAKTYSKKFCRAYCQDAIDASKSCSFVRKRKRRSANDTLYEDVPQLCSTSVETYNTDEIKSLRDMKLDGSRIISSDGRTTVASH